MLDIHNDGLTGTRSAWQENLAALCVDGKLLEMFLNKYGYSHNHPIFLKAILPEKIAGLFQLVESETYIGN